MSLHPPDPGTVRRSAAMPAALLAAVFAGAGSGVAAPGAESHAARQALAPPPIVQAPVVPRTHACVQRFAPADPRRVPLRRTGPHVGATGDLAVTFARSPFGVAVTPDGRHVQRIEVRVEGLRRGARGSHVVWAATPSLDEARRLGTLDRAGGKVVGLVPWNQFMVIVTEEPSADVERWRGPVLLTGFSPSSRMHTMRGHGIFEPHGAGC